MLIVGMMLATAGAGRAAADGDTLASARSLYISAAYEDALAELDRLRSSGPPAPEQRAIDQYRISCLLALGRTIDAERLIEAIVTVDPWYFPAADDVAPRVRTVFDGVRNRHLPDVVEQTYAKAKAAYDNRDFVNAAAGFGDVIRLLGDPAMKGPSQTPPFSDLKMLASGFRDLSISSAPPPPLPARATEIPAVPPVIAAPAPSKIYDADEAGVVPPVAIRQDTPPFRGVINRPLSGLLEVVINEQGVVESAVMRGHTTSTYDSAVLSAVTAWRYQPATVDGKPVKFRKRVGIRVDLNSR
jgi:TonB family protein